MLADLVPEAWLSLLSDCPTYGLFLVLIAALYVLSQGADWMIDAATHVAVRMGLPKVVVGATIVSLGTTTPECAVSVMAAWNGEPGLALGNAIGSVIADTALIFGLGCLLITLPADRMLLNRQGWVQFGTAVLLAAICYFEYWRVGDAAVISRPVGMLLLALLGVYLWISVVWSREHARQVATASGEPVEAVLGHEEPSLEADLHLEHSGHNFPLIVARGVAGLVMVLLASEFAIEAVSLLALRLGVPEVVISATLVALGTSTPELVVGLMSIRRGHPELLVGNVIGADILNILFVTGAAAAASPLAIVDTDPGVSFPRMFLALHLPVMLGVLLYFRLCIFRASRQGHFDRWMGWPLVASYLAFVVVSLIAGRAG